MDCGLRIPKAPLVQMHCAVIYVQYGNRFRAEFCQFHVSKSRENVVSNQRYMIGIRRIGPMSLSIEFYILLKQLRQIVGMIL